MHFVKAQGILSARNGMNIFRGCNHGCIYCDSRSKCYQINHDFTDIAVKENAPELLESTLKSKKKPCMISTGSMCDPYIPLESEIKYTQKCLGIIAKYKFGLSILTKSDGILRDLKLLKKINEQAKCVVQMTLTTFDERLCSILEPNVCGTARRVEVLRIMRDEGIPTIVWLCPLLPYINDTEENLLGILDYCGQVGVYGIINFGMGLTLREGSREYFYDRLDEHFPTLRQKYHARYGNSYELPSDNSAALYKTYYLRCKELAIETSTAKLFAYMNDLPSREQQLKLF